ncbi:MAG: ATP-binding protein [Fimbriimonadaceae bacterium]|nr:ATP-binding protein [Fimbriimonadaceae bacterium]
MCLLYQEPLGRNLSNVAASEQPALRLTPDEWMEALGFDGFDEEARARVEAIQWQVAARALTLGLDVVLDFGFWSRAERDDCRSRARALGAACEVCFLDVPRAELLARLAGRNEARPPSTFVVDEGQLDAYAKVFEPPAPDELATDGP